MKKKRNLKIRFIENAKIKKWLIKILYVMIVICILYHVMYILNTGITKNEYFSLFGTSFLTVKTKAMKPDLQKNDFVIVKEKEGLEVGELIAYQIHGNIRINKIISIKSENGTILYSTKSNENYYPDIEKITENQIIGKVIKRIPILGAFRSFLESKVNTVIIIVLIMLKFSYNKYAYKQLRQRKRKKIKKEG